MIDTLLMKLDEKKGMRLNMIIGVDGFVDEIIHVVDKRQDFDTFTRIRRIEDFGKRIVNAAGLSTNVEFVSNQTKLGGNGPIYANALLEYGAEVTYIGALGEQGIHHVFKPMAERCAAVYSLCDPGHTDAVEFDDGKLIIGKMSTLSKITWERVTEIVGSPEKIAAMIDACDLFGMENWTMIPHMSELWERIIEEVFPLLKRAVAEKPIAFFDLADPEKRTAEDILRAMKLIGRFEEKFRTILGLNEKEAYEIAGVFGIKIDRGLQGAERLRLVTTAIREELDVYCVVVHPTREAAACVNGEYFQVDGPFCERPVLTTGAGDNFNAGFSFGQALGLDAQSSLLLGTATSGFYVRNAKSPSLDDVCGFLKSWKLGAI